MKANKLLNRVFNIDCLKFMTKLPDNCIDLILTDPPYGIGFKDNIRSSKYWSKNKKSVKQTDLVSNTVTNDNIGDLNWSLLFNQFYRILKPKKSIYLFCRTDVIINWAKNILESDFRYSHDFLWLKGDMGYGNLNIPGSIHEMVLALSKDSAEKSRPMTVGGSVKKRVPASFLGKLSKKEYYGHPTQKPIDLLTFIISLRTDEGDVVFDPFSGVASTAIACKLINRRFIACEIDKLIHAQGNRRLRDKEHIEKYREVMKFESNSLKLNSGKPIA